VQRYRARKIDLMEGFMCALPRIISVDDHVIEPMDLWTDRLPAKYHDRAPRIERKRGTPTYPVPPSPRQIIEEDARVLDRAVMEKVFSTNARELYRIR
jgi:hypothetical protein